MNTLLGIHAHYDKMQLQDKGRKSESYSFRVMSLVNFEICLNYLLK